LDVLQISLWLNLIPFSSLLLGLVLETFLLGCGTVFGRVAGALLSEFILALPVLISLNLLPFRHHLRYVPLPPWLIRSPKLLVAAFGMAFP
jgi:hypothetical protein